MVQYAPWGMREDEIALVGSIVETCTAQGEQIDCLLEIVERLEARIDFLETTTPDDPRPRRLDP